MPGKVLKYLKSIYLAPIFAPKEALVPSFSWPSAFQIQMTMITPYQKALKIKIGMRNIFLLEKRVQ